MTTKERADELIEAGAAMQVYPPGGDPVTVLLAALAWLPDPRRVRWCGIFPADQHHIHETPYTTTTLAAGGRDVALYNGKEMVAYIAPFEESGLDEGESRGALVEWQNQQDIGGNKKTFENFFNEA